MVRRIITIALPLLLLAVGCTLDPEARNQKLLESGNRYFETGKFKEASIFYQRAIQQDRRFGEAYYRLGLSEYRLGRIASSLAALTRACELQPKNEDAYSRVADLYIGIMAHDTRNAEGYLQELRRLTKRAEENFPDTFAIHRVKGLIAAADNNSDEAIQNFRLALDLKPDDVGVAVGLARSMNLAGQQEDATRFARGYIEQHKNALAMYDYLYRDLFLAERRDDALQMLQSKLANNPDHLPTKLQLARHFALVNDRDAMIKVLDGILDGPNPGSVEFSVVGDFYVMAREYDRAVQVYRRAQTAVPAEKTTFALKVVESLAAQDRKEEAYRLVDEIVKEYSSGDDPRTLTVRGRALALRGALRLQTGDPAALQAAITDFEAALSRMSDNVVLRYNLGQAYLAAGNRDRAIVEFQQAIDRRPDYLAPRFGLARVYLQSQEYAKVVAVAEEILKLRPNDDRANLIRSYAWINIGEKKQARSTLEELLVKQPNSAEPTYQLARINMLDQNYREAERLYQRLATADPPDPRGILGLAEARALTGRRDEGLRLIQEQINKGQNQPFWRLAYGVAASRWGAWPQAEAMLRQVITDDPENQVALKHLGGVLYQTKRADQSMQSFERASQLGPNDPAPLLYMGLIQMNKGQLQQAAAKYQRVIELTPDNAIALNNLAWILTETGGDLDRALTLCQRAIGISPNNADIADTLAQIYIKKNLNDSAIRILESLVARDAKRVVWRYHLGLALFQKGDYARAKRELETALASNPSREQETDIRRLLAKVNA